MKKSFPLLLVLSLLCLYILLTIQLPQFTQKGPPTDLDRSNFIDFTKEIWLIVAIILLTTLSLSRKGSQNEANQVSWKVWLSGMITILGITTLSVLIFNPSGAFTWSINHVANRDTRLVKPYLYDQLNPAPDIVFLGTSISYRIRAQEYAQKLSLTGFNFSMLGGTSVDYSTITNLILSKSALNEKPDVLVVEILSPSLGPSHAGVTYYEKYPLEYTKYMPFKFAVETISAQLDKIFTFSSFSQFIYVEYFTWKKQWNEKVNLSPDGTASPVNRIQKKAAYKKAVAKVGKSLDELLQCTHLDTDGQDAILKMVALSKEQHISIVFYRSPINNDFYRIKNKKATIYKPCEESFNQFMKQIEAENPNVFYSDLSHYAPISSGGKALYIDSHHLNSIGSDNLLKVLTPTIQSAIQYVQPGKINSSAP